MNPDRTTPPDTGLARRTRLAVLPQPAFWGLWVAVLSVAVLALGFYAVGTPDFSAGEFRVDQDLSRNHAGILTVLAMELNTVFSPLGGLVLIAGVCLFLLFVRRSPINAFAFGGVAAAGWLSSQFFKAVVERQRPNPVLLVDPLAPETGSNSFPSGHVALAVGLGLLVPAEKRAVGPACRTSCRGWARCGGLVKALCWCALPQRRRCLFPGCERCRLLVHSFVEQVSGAGPAPHSAAWPVGTCHCAPSHCVPCH